MISAAVSSPAGHTTAPSWHSSIAIVRPARRPGS